MSSKVDIYSLYKYATDRDCFFRVGSKRELSKKAIFKRIKEFEPDYNDKKIEEIIEGLEGFGVPFKQIFQHSAKPDLPTCLETAYINLGPNLPIRFLYAKNAALLYYINEAGEYVHWATATPDSFLDLVLSINTILQKFKAEYKAPEIHAGFIRTKLQLSEFIKKLYEQFRTDFDSKQMADRPKLLTWADEVAYKRLDPSLLKNGPTPAWDSFLSRVDQPEVFMAYVWAIFDERNKGRQCLWMYGHGHDGKSTVINAFLDWFGRQHSFMIAEGDYQNAFFFGKVHGKRVGAFMDCTNPTLLRQGRIKQILGGDTVDINDKFQTPFSAEVYARLFILSNEPPQIVYEDESQRTRLLVVRISKFKDDRGDANFRQTLVAEMPAFLAKCKQVYPTYFTTGFNMKPPEAMDDFIKTVCATIDSDMMQDFISQHLRFGPQESVTKLELVTFYKQVNGVSAKPGTGTDFGLNAFIKEIMGRGLIIERVWNADRTSQHRIIRGVSLQTKVQEGKLIPITKNKIVGD